MLAAMSSKERCEQSQRICRTLGRTDCYRSARYVLAYAALPTEVQTGLFLKQCLRENRRLCLPRVAKNGKDLELFRVMDLGRDLLEGSFGIQEPRRLARRKVRLRDIDLIVVPGLGFDRRGGRLGRGKGFYDRLLIKADHIPKVGLAYRCQIMRSVPMEEGDVFLDDVITDQ